MENRAIVYAEPDNEGFIAGTRRSIKGVSRLEWIINVLLALVLGATAIFGAAQVQQNNAILTNGIEIRAEVISHRTIAGSRSDSYYVTYTYEVKGRTYSHEESVDRTRYTALAVGRTVTVRYLEADPTEARLSGEFKGDSTIEAVVFGLLVLMTLLLILSPIIRTWQSRRFSSQGQQLNGVLTGLKRQRSRYGLKFKFEYTFRSPLGVELTGKRTVKRNDLRKTLPPTGSPVKVLYISDKNHRML